MTGGCLHPLPLAATVVTHATVWFDGACYGNPGPTGGGAIVDIEGRRTQHSQRGPRGTNNEAEYLGLITGLKAAKAAGATSLTVKGDSQLIIRQLEGQYKVKAANLRPMFEEAKALLRNFEQVRLEWVRRDLNAEADAAARAAID